MKNTKSASFSMENSLVHEFPNMGVLKDEDLTASPLRKTLRKLSTNYQSKFYESCKDFKLFS
jgi:hypothetical protein